MRDWLTKKKVFESCVVFLKVCVKSREGLILIILDCNNVEFLYNE